MNVNLITAFKYLYLSAQRDLEDSNCKGLKRKQLYSFVKSFNDVSKAVENGNIKDLEEVLNYGK